MASLVNGSGIQPSRIVNTTTSLGKTKVVDDNGSDSFLNLYKGKVEVINSLNLDSGINDSGFIDTYCDSCGFVLPEKIDDAKRYVDKNKFLSFFKYRKDENKTFLYRGGQLDDLELSEQWQDIKKTCREFSDYCFLTQSDCVNVQWGGQHVYGIDRRQAEVVLLGKNEDGTPVKDYSAICRSCSQAGFFAISYKLGGKVYHGLFKPVLKVLM